MRIGSRGSIAIHCLLFISEYAGSQKVTSDLLSSSTGCNAVTIRSIMSSLKKAGMIDTAAGTGGTCLAKNPEDINLYEIAAAADPQFLDKMIASHPDPNILCPIGQSIQEVLEMPRDKIRDKVIESMQAISLLDLSSYYHEIRDEEASEAPSGHHRKED